MQVGWGGRCVDEGEGCGVVSRSQTLSSIAQHRRGKGLGAFPGDDVSFPLGQGEVININRRFDLLRESWPCLCARRFHWL